MRFSVLFLLFHFGCSKADFTGIASGSSKNQNTVGEKQKLEYPDIFGSGEIPDSFTKYDSANDGNADVVLVGSDGRRVLEYYSFQSDIRIDFLFIVDNSSSMASILTKTRAGFRSLADDDLFPSNSRIAVMTTLIGAGPAYNEVHPVVEGVYTGINSEPGFLSLVSRESIEKYRAVAPSGKQAKFTIDGCEEWFKPGDTNANGESCIEAHTQTSRTGTGVEAGATALKQLLFKNKGKEIFRKGASANVVYVSDTHDPGREHAGLKASRPTFAEIESLVQVANTVSTFKIHALAPESACAEEGIHDRWYFKMIDSGKGAKQDICGATDYSPLIKSIVDDSLIIDNQVMATAKDIVAVEKITVDGQEFSDYEITGTRTIRLNGVSSAKKVLLIYNAK